MDNTACLAVGGTPSQKLVVVFCFWFLCAGAMAQDQDVLCNAGSGSFRAAFMNTGISVQVGASRTGELASRSCQATLDWSTHALVIVKNAAQVDVDVFGADIGLEKPVAAFQVKMSDDICCREYQIYSLSAPPKLLRTITGADTFSAADKDLDGRVEIWTDDAAAINHFDGLSLAEFDLPPPVVLRFSKGKLFDVSAEFPSYFDEQIANLRRQLNSNGLHDFKASDGLLVSDQASSAERMHRLRTVKAAILEIVWCYLYSGRQQQAWAQLEEMWPSGDTDRIRAAILHGRASGIAAQVDGVLLASSKRNKHAPVFDVVNVSPEQKSDITPPEPIMLNRPPLLGTSGQVQSPTETVLQLVIDEAGKVRSADPVEKGMSDPALIDATAGWKFIPAFKDGRSVACKTRMSISLRQ